MHTPGPWYTKEGTHHTVIRSEFEDTKLGREIAWVDLEAEADANLIAAAPDLLAACQLCLQKVPYGALWDGHGKHVQWVKLMRAAIQKATGMEVRCPDPEICPTCGNRMKDNVCLTGCERR